MTKGYRNFLIVGTQRTGSSALAEAIANRVQVACGWEWTQRVAPWRQIKFATLGLQGEFNSLAPHHREHMQRTLTTECRWLGFRRLFRSSNKWFIHPRFAPALLQDRLDGHISWIAKNPELYIVHIVRHDNMEWLKSKYVSKATGSYVGKQYPAELKVKIPVNEAIARLQSKRWVDSRLSALRNTNPYIQITYEDFARDPRNVTARVYKLFGLDEQPQYAEAKISRQSRGTASDYILNFAELQQAMEARRLITSHLHD